MNGLLDQGSLESSNLAESDHSHTFNPEIEAQGRTARHTLISKHHQSFKVRKPTRHPHSIDTQSILSKTTRTQICASSRPIA